jgi:anti-sigma factor RsiW
VQCPESLRVQAYFDAEVDALAGADIERHLAHCTECRALRSHLEELRAALRRDIPYIQAPPALRRQVMQALDTEIAADTSRHRRVSQTPARRRSFWIGAASGFATAAATATVALFVLALPFANPVVDELLGAHLSSLRSSHLVEVVSTDQHTVKPWFAGRVAVAPAVADFASQGYKLTGGRVDYLEHQRAAVVVYQHGAHVINVFCWVAPRGPLPGNATRKGYHMAFWRIGDLAYAAVSDTGWDELVGLEHLLRDLGASDSPPDNSSPNGE